MDTFKARRVTVISSAPLIMTAAGTFLYKPYETEMQIWAKNTASISFCCPIWNEDRNLLKSAVSFSISDITELKEFHIKSLLSVFTVIPAVFYNSYQIYKSMRSADHIHLRCPGNMGLIGCVVQVFFPNKKKTAKYAGNWDLKAKQPWSYRLQKWILNNTMLTKNMQVLVYGAWEGSSKNIKSFFTATYSESEKEEVKKRDWSGSIRFMFVGTLVDGKRPLYALQLVEELVKDGKTVSLQFLGEGHQRELLEDYIATHKLGAFVKLEGNQTKETVLEAYKNAHFLILASKSEGWPKVVPEAMFWGAVPIATKISCVPYMLDDGKRGILLEMNLEKDVSKIRTILDNAPLLDEMTQKGVDWSRHYTLEKFESEIKALL